MVEKLVAFGGAVTTNMLEKSGMNLEFLPTTKVRLGNIYEGPCSIATSIKDINKFGAFSYINGRGRFTNVSIGRYCSIAEQVSVGYPEHPTGWLSSSTLQYQKPKWAAGLGEWQRYRHEPNKITTIGNDVWIGAGAFLRSGIKIGNGAIIGAHAVVTKDVEPYNIVAGNPARVLRKRIDDRMARCLMDLAWWEYSPVQLSGCDFSSPQNSISFIEKIRDTGISPYIGPKLVIKDDGASMIPASGSSLPNNEK